MARRFLFENPLSPHRPKIWLFFFSPAKCLNPIWQDLLMAIISHKLIKSRQSFPFLFFFFFHRNPYVQFSRDLSFGDTVSQAPSSNLSHLDYVQFQSGVLMFSLILFQAFSVIVFYHFSCLCVCTLASALSGLRWSSGQTAKVGILKQRSLFYLLSPSAPS